MKRLRAAVIGLGVGEQHISGYDAHPSSETVAICDIDAAKLAEVAARFPNVTVTTEPDAILRDTSIDVVSIASPDDCHHRQVLAALQAGKHVFVEKPLCLNPGEMADIRAELAKRRNQRFGCNLILRQSPRFLDLRERIRNGELGDLYQIDAAYNYGRLWKITQGWRGAVPNYSVTLGGGIHLLDLMLWMLGCRVSQVAAVGSRIATAGSQVQFDDAVTAVLHFENGAIGTLSSNFGCVYPHFHKFVAYGTNATFENRPSDALLFTSRDPAVPPRPVTTAYPGVAKWGLIGNFVDSILGMAPALVESEEVFDCMTVGFAIDEALHTRKSVVVDYQRPSTRSDSVARSANERF
jgi:predicted dehydrogenase